MDRYQGKGKVQGSDGSPPNPVTTVLNHQVLCTSVTKNELLLREIFTNSSDVVLRKIPVARRSNLLLIYIDGLVDTQLVNEVVLKPLLSPSSIPNRGRVHIIREALSKQIVAAMDTETVASLTKLVQEILHGGVAIMMDGLEQALVVRATKLEKRGVDKPDNEASLRGPRDCFTETLRTNTSLLRRRMKNPNLKMEAYVLGGRTQTDVVIAYVEDLVVGSVLEEVRRRLTGIPLNDLVDSGYIEEYIQDSNWSPWPQVQNTERPDVATASLLEGKVAILMDGTPFVLLAPMTFWAGLQAADDHYERFAYAVFRRSVRYIMSLISVTLPGTYVALTTHNSAMLPAQLMTSIATAREISPFPTVIEITLMEFIFDGLQEAGIRLPGQMGPVISIVGALVVGEAAVRANIVSAPVVIVVALTGIAAYGLPRYSFGIPFRMLRYALLFMSGMLGLFGLSIGMGFILIHLVALESFGEPYFTPVAPLVFYHLRDVDIRTPRWRKSNGNRSQSAWKNTK